MINPGQMPYLPVSSGNHLVRTDSQRKQKKGWDNDDDYYDEVDQDGEVVAKYHVWHYLNIYPPQHVKEGWTKFDTSGLEVCSGKCK